MNHGPLDASTALGLKALRARIDASDIPSSKLDETINIATWNIREFGRKPRKPASLHYIAEILGAFDLIAVVELRDNLSDMETVLRYLGPTWRVLYSDFLTDSGGNRERMAYVYDERAVSFTGLASNAYSPRKKNAAGEYLSEISWWRAPFIASFAAGNFDFVMMTAHVRWGSGEKERISELRFIADWVADRRSERYVGDKDFIVLGDFNIPRRESPLFDAIASKGLKIPLALMTAPGTDLAKGKRYDQILHDPVFTKSFAKKGGVLDFYDGDHRPLYPDLPMSKTEFTYELSDHLPLWIQVNTNIDDELLDVAINRRR